MTKRTWLGAVALLFAWGFVMHGAGLVLHEVGGHGLAAAILACGIDRINLTYFGGGSVHFVPCARWTWTTWAIAVWAGIAVTTAAGAAAMVLQRRRGLSPLERLLVALLGTGFLLVQLAYATTGSFYKLDDPGMTARALAERGLHVVAWLPPLVLFAASAVLGACAIVDALRDHFGSRTRLERLKHFAWTIGLAGLLYFVAFYLEWAHLADSQMRSMTQRAAQLAAMQHQAPPFPIGRVLIALIAAAFVIAFARPVSHPNAAAMSEIPRRLAAMVAVAALVCGVAIVLLVRV